jgi:hypothetical protein
MSLVVVIFIEYEYPSVLILYLDFVFIILPSPSKKPRKKCGKSSLEIFFGGFNICDFCFIQPLLIKSSTVFYEVN